MARELKYQPLIDVEGATSRVHNTETNASR